MVRQHFSVLPEYQQVSQSQTRIANTSILYLCSLQMATTNNPRMHEAPKMHLNKNGQ